MSGSAEPYKDSMMSKSANVAGVPAGRRGVYVATCLAGLAVIGGGTYLMTDEPADGLSEPTSKAMSSASPPSMANPALPSTAAATKAQPGGTKPATTSPLPGPTIELGKEASERLAAAKEAGKADIEAQRAIPHIGPEITEPIQVREEGSVQEKGKMLRVVSARQDLTGYSELGWVADEGTRVGSSRCSKKIKLSNESEPRTRPTMLICWRVSQERSVYTLLVDLNSKPSQQDSVAAIDKTWAKLD